MQMFAQLDKWHNLLSFRDCSHLTVYIFHHCKKLCPSDGGNPSQRKRHMFREV